MQGLKGGFGPALLDKSNDDVDNDRALKHACIDPVPEQGCDSSRGQHDVEQKVVEMPKEPIPGTWSFGNGQVIGADGP